MYKYRYNNEFHLALDFLDARQQTGRALPKGLSSVSQFIVRIWYWEENEKDFSVEVFDPPGHQVFGVYDDALKCFNALATVYPDEAREEIKLELVQYHRGKITTYLSKILFPSVLLTEQ